MSDVYKLQSGPKAGRYLRAQWDATNAQYTSSDIRVECAFMGYRYTYARTLEALASQGIRTYASASAARREE